MFQQTFNDLISDDFPDGEYLIHWPNNLYKHPSKSRDYFMKIALKNLATKEFITIERNLSELPAIFLGGIIRNKSLTAEKTGRTFTFSFKITETQKLVRIPDLYLHGENWYFPNKNISSNFYGKEYALGFYNSVQKGIELKRSQTTVFFPSYVIAQYFYMRAEAFTRQLLSDNTKYTDLVAGLYSSIKVYPNSEVDILTTPHLNKHAPEIVRFALDSYANQCFNNFYKNIFQSQIMYRQRYDQGNNTLNSSMATLSCYFPVLGDIDISFRGIKLSENYYLAFEILQENSTYPFKSLYKIIHKAPEKKHATSTGDNEKPPVRIKAISHKLTRKTPNSKFYSANLSNGVIKDSRAGLATTFIDTKTISKESKKSDSRIFEKTGEQINLSSDHEESSGDTNTVHGTPEFQLSDEDKIPPGLEEFRKMILEASAASKKFAGFTYSIDELDFPETFDNNQNICLRTLLIDNKTRRRYLVTKIDYQGQSFTAIDLQKDRRLPMISILLLKRNDGLLISENIIQMILKSFARTKKTWLEGIDQDELIYIPLKHAQTCDEHSISLWAKRFQKALKKSPKGWCR